ncbi:MAG: hypothetical protein IT162_06535 [Bryobacterales bacterium]|nr:hypothetical protein [Bryobacterales bacterium]
MTPRNFEDNHELAECLCSVQRGLEQAQRGEGRPMREFLESLAAEYGISLR